MIANSYFTCCASIDSDQLITGPVGVNNQDQKSSLTNRSYWEGAWQSVELPKLVDLSDRGLRNHANMIFHPKDMESRFDIVLSMGLC